MIIENIQHQLINTCELYKEKMVAIKKLEWWIEEAKNMLKNSANHPSTKALATIKDSLDINNEDLLMLFQMKAKLLHGQNFDDESSLNQYIHQQYAKFEHLKAEILLDQTLGTKSLDIINLMTESMEKIRYIYLLAHHKVNQLYLIPGIDANTRKTEQLSILNTLCEKLINENKNIKLNAQNRALKPILNRYKLHFKLLKLMKKNKFNVENIRIELSPLQMLFSVK